MDFTSFLKVLRGDARLTRRQACQLGGLLGLSFSAVCQLWARPVRARSRNVFNKEVAMRLPAPVLDGNISLEKTIRHRRTIRSYSEEPFTLAQLSQILWAAQGITEDGGFKRAAPSGGALYPIDVYAVVGQNGVQGLRQGIYRYDPPHHSLEERADTDARKDVARAALTQMWVAGAPVVLVLTAEYRRITGKYGNIFLQCDALGLAAGIVGAFDDNKVARTISAKKNHEPLIIMPVGWQR